MIEAELKHSINTRWHPFALSFNSVFSPVKRLAVCSFEKENINQILVYNFIGPSIELESVSDIQFPQIQCKFSPFASKDETDFMLTCAETLKLFQVSPQGLALFSEIDVSEEPEPITAVDWGTYQENVCICCGSDCAASSVDLETQQVTARIMAHDHQVHDIQFVGPTPTFVTAGFDGSMRFFDLRDLASSIIYFQTLRPLLRLSVSPWDANKIATFSSDSRTITIIDVRQPGVPSAVIKGFDENISCIDWSRTVENVVFGSTINGKIKTAVVNDGVAVPTVFDCITEKKSIQSFCIGHGMSANASESSVSIFGIVPNDRNRERYSPIDMFLQTL